MLKLLKRAGRSGVDGCRDGRLGVLMGGVQNLGLLQRRSQRGVHLEAGCRWLLLLLLGLTLLLLLLLVLLGDDRVVVRRLVLLVAQRGGIRLLGERGITDALAVMLRGGRCRHRDQLLDLKRNGKPVGVRKID